jgi:hypothetical protein
MTVSIFNLYRKLLLKHYIANPCLSVEVDYTSESNRYRFYKKMFAGLSDDEILEEVLEIF